MNRIGRIDIEFAFEISNIGLTLAAKGWSIGWSINVSTLVPLNFSQHLIESKLHVPHSLMAMVFVNALL